MKAKALAVMAILCLMLCFTVAVDTPAAYAQDDGGLASKKPGELGKKDWDESQLPGNKEIGMAIGSIFVMIAVVKWL